MGSVAELALEPLLLGYLFLRRGDIYSVTAPHHLGVDGLDIGTVDAQIDE